MKRRVFNLIIAAVIFVCSNVSFSVEPIAPIKVTCIGNSITYGAGIKDRGNNSYPTQLAAGPAGSQVLRVDPKDMSIEGDLGTFKSSWDIKYPEAGVMLATLTLESPEAAEPPKFDIKWDIPTVDIDSVWVSDYSKEKLNHGWTKIESRAVQRAPLITYLSQADQNRFTVALSDCLRPIMLKGGVKEEDGRLYFTASLFKEKHPVIKKYQVTLRFDSRSKPYYKVLKDTAKWWAAQEDCKPAPVSEAARVPVYSTWYNYHQSVDPDRIVEDCRLGGKLGLEGVIVDDGWQTMDSSRGYAYTGDWKPERIPDMKGFVDRIHALDQKIWLWYSVPMVGDYSEAVKKFKSKTLKYHSGFKAWVLDPRYPEVREYLIGIYENAVRDWGLDGLKLDFIGMFAPDDKTVLTAEDGRDYASVDKAVDRLLTDVMARLRKIKPDIAIEFRQPYNGPLMRKYGNMFRAVDCPYTAAVNRKLTVDVRLLSDSTTVHSDPIIWHPDEPVETAALQILNILFSVPQISVRLAEVSEDHRTMIGFWMKYWKENRGVLLDGEFMPVSPGQNYPMVSARTDKKLIAALYQNMVVKPGPDAPAQIDVVNGQSNSDGTVVLFSQAFGQAQVRIYDTRGKVVSESNETIDAGAKVWKVPPSGLLEIRRTDQKK